MTQLSVENGTLVVEIQGFDKVLTLKNKITVPLANIVSAEIDTKIGEEIVQATHVHHDALDRIVSHGTEDPKNSQRMGSFKDTDGIVFYDVHDASKAIVVHLDHEKYTRLVLEVENPQAAVELINTAKKTR